MADSARRQLQPDGEVRALRRWAHEPASTDRPAPAESPIAAQLLGLQRLAGNAAVSRLLADHDDKRESGRKPANGAAGETRTPGTPAMYTTVDRHARTLAAVIKRAPIGQSRKVLNGGLAATGEAGAAAVGTGGDRDAEVGLGVNEVADPAVVNATLMSQKPQVPQAEEGKSAAVPDIVMPESLVVAEADTIAGALTYSPSDTRSGAVSPFGATTWSRFNMTGITVTPGTGTFAVTATVENPITYNVASPKTSIASETDPALTSANYGSAATDLTPNMGDLGGRPPRGNFWAEDLTLKHERFHVSERRTFGGQGVTDAQTWLNGQTAASVADVQTLLTQVPAKVIAYSQANMAMPGKEERAYGDGAADYRARATAIKTRGDAGNYAAPPAAPAP